MVVGGRRWSLLFLGHVSPASCPGARPRHYPPSVGGSAKLEPAPQSLWSRSRTFGALCRWPPRTQSMAGGAQANPKGCRRKVLGRHSSRWRGPSLKASSPVRTSRYVLALLGWKPPWEGRSHPVPPGSAPLGALLPRGAGQVGGIQIFLEVLVTGLGQQEPGPQCCLGHPGTALMAPVMIMRPKKEQQAQNCRKAEGRDSGPGFLPLADLAWL